MVQLVLGTLLMILPLGRSMGQEEHEYSSIRSSQQDPVRELLNFPVTSPSGQVVGILDSFETSGYPPVLLISFVAEWCEHCNYEAPFLSEVSKAWGKRGLGMVAVFEYTERDKAQEFVERYGLTISWYLGQIPGKFENLRETTTHYKLRTLLDDKRGWGTPFHIMLVRRDRKKVYFASGEFVREELLQQLEEWLPPHR